MSEDKSCYSLGDELTAANERIRELSQAVGLATTLAGSVEVDVNNPVAMMQLIVASVNERIEVSDKLEKALEYASQIIGHPDDAGSQFIRAALSEVAAIRKGKTA